jgi:hypothetical protein
VLYGLREWEVRSTAEGPRLHALFRSARWRAGPAAVTTARCLVSPSHHAPDGSCDCGLYALHPSEPQCRASFAAAEGAASEPAAWRREARVVGMVAAWGEVELHESGFRSEHARPHLFLLPRDAGEAYARTVRALAGAHGAEVLEVGSAEELYRHCAAYDLGLGESALRRLLADRWRAARRRKRAQRVAESLAPLVGTIGALLFNPLSLLIVAGFVIGRLDGGEPVRPAATSRTSAMEVLEQRVVRVGDEDLYVAIVRNPSRTRTALDVHPLGRFLDRRGRHLGRPSVLADNRPSLAPGQTGVLFDFVDERRSVAPAVARVRVRVHAHRMVGGVPRSPVRVARVRLDHRRCIATASVWSSRRRLRADLAGVVRDGGGRIVNAGWWVAGPLARGWSRQVVGRLAPAICARHGLAGEAHPNLTATELRRPAR